MGKHHSGWPSIILSGASVYNAKWLAPFGQFFFLVATRGKIMSLLEIT